MDSLTQIVLGAAIGELAQGRKLGNRAMVWGAIAGTIPDLDVFVGKLYTDPVDELAFHRGISHSFFFAATFSVVLSALTYWIYDKGNYKKLPFAYAFIGLMVAAMIAIMLKTSGGSLGLLGSGVLLLPTVWYAVYRYQKYRSGDSFVDLNIGMKGWYKLFFWTIITHPILDCFTVYGTQIFLPFSNYRVGFDNISVADPAYTVPFLICLIIASILSRGSKYRHYFNVAGLVISSLYMCWTFYNKHNVNKVVEQNIASQGIKHSRYMTSPTILNNILWTTTIEADSVYYQGQYSLLDPDQQIELVPVKKNRHYIPDGAGDHTIETLRWFSDDYYGIMKRKDGRLQINDLRYGSFSGKAIDENDFVFRFIVEKEEDGSYSMEAADGGPKRGQEKEMFSKLLSRISGDDPSRAYKNGIVVSAHTIASEIGVDILKQGGNAYDAAVAVHFALAVVYPRAGNLGGGGFATIHTATGLSSTLDFREAAPAAARRDMYLDADGQVVKDRSLRGPLASGVPGSVMGMLMLHDSLGSLPMRDLLQPAIELALDGYTISANETKRLNHFKDQFEINNTIPTPFTKADQWRQGELLQNIPLGTTLKRLQTYGLREFYTGQTAEYIAEYYADSGDNYMTLSDLTSYKAVWRQPITCNYHDLEVISMAPPSSGGVALCQILDGVQDENITALPYQSSEYIHHIAELEKRVFTVRNQLMGDPDFVDVDIKQLLSDEFTAQLFDDITSRATIAVIDSVNSIPLIKEAYETTHFSIMDSDGNAVSITTTLNGNFGSFVVIPQTGILMNNQMDDFTAKPGSANQYGLLGSEKNAIEPGKRMLSSMTPTIVLRDGKPYMILGSPGGPTIITSVLQTILNVTDHHMDIQQAVDAPRFHDQGYPIGVLVEKDRLPSATIEELKQRGHTVRTTGYIGAVEAILVLPDGTMTGGADSKRGKDDGVSGY